MEQLSYCPSCLILSIWTWISQRMFRCNRSMFSEKHSHAVCSPSKSPSVDVHRALLPFGLLNIFSHLFPFSLSLFDPLCNWDKASPSLYLSCFSLSLVLSCLSCYIISHQYLYLRSRASHHCLCQMSEYKMGQTTKSSHGYTDASALCGTNAHTAIQWRKTIITH